MATVSSDQRLKRALLSLRWDQKDVQSASQIIQREQTTDLPRCRDILYWIENQNKISDSFLTKTKPKEIKSVPNDIDQNACFTAKIDTQDPLLATKHKYFEKMDSILNDINIYNLSLSALSLSQFLKPLPLELRIELLNNQYRNKVGWNTALYIVIGLLEKPILRYNSKSWQSAWKMVEILLQNGSHPYIYNTDCEKYQAPLGLNEQENQNKRCLIGIYKVYQILKCYDIKEEDLLSKLQYFVSFAYQFPAKYISIANHYNSSENDKTNKTTIFIGSLCPNLLKCSVATWTARESLKMHFLKNEPGFYNLSELRHYSADFVRFLLKHSLNLIHIDHGALISIMPAFGGRRAGANDEKEQENNTKLMPKDHATLDDFHEALAGKSMVYSHEMTFLILRSLSLEMINEESKKFKDCYYELSEKDSNSFPLFSDDVLTIVMDYAFDKCSYLTFKGKAEGKFLTMAITRFYSLESRKWKEYVWNEIICKLNGTQIDAIKEYMQFASNDGWNALIESFKKNNDRIDWEFELNVTFAKWLIVNKIMSNATVWIRTVLVNSPTDIDLLRLIAKNCDGYDLEKVWGFQAVRYSYHWGYSDFDDKERNEWTVCNSNTNLSMQILYKNDANSEYISVFIDYMVALRQFLIGKIVPKSADNDDDDGSDSEVKDDASASVSYSSDVFDKRIGRVILLSFCDRYERCKYDRKSHLLSNVVGLMKALMGIEDNDGGMNIVNDALEFVYDCGSLEIFNAFLENGLLNARYCVEKGIIQAIWISFVGQIKRTFVHQKHYNLMKCIGKWIADNGHSNLVIQLAIQRQEKFEKEQAKRKNQIAYLKHVEMLKSLIQFWSKK